MPRESVVDALNTIHRALRPNGILLDIHPRDVPSPVSALFADQTSNPIGETFYAGSFIGDVEAAESALALQETQGHYANEQQTEFDFLHHFTLDQWHTYFTAEADDYRPLAAELTTAVNHAMQTPGTTLTMGERLRATRYRAKTS